MRNTGQFKHCANVFLLVQGKHSANGCDTGHRPFCPPTVGSPTCTPQVQPPPFLPCVSTTGICVAAFRNLPAIAAVSWQCASHHTHGR